jgi:hypothetical protein
MRDQDTGLSAGRAILLSSCLAIVIVFGGMAWIEVILAAINGDLLQ